MDFLLRAQKALDRGDAVRGLVQLVEGLRRHPEREDALDLLLYTYTRSVEYPGVESDMLRALEFQPARGELLGLLCEDLESREKVAMARALRQLAREQGMDVIVPAPAVPGARDGDAEQGTDDAEESAAGEPPGEGNGGLAAEASVSGESLARESEEAPEQGEREGARKRGEVLQDPVEVERAQVVRRDVGLPTTEEIERRRPSHSPRHLRRRVALVALGAVALAVLGATTWAGWEHTRRVRLQAELDTRLESLDYMDLTPLDDALAGASRGHRESSEVVERWAFASAVQTVELGPGEEEVGDGELGEGASTAWGMAARALLATAAADWEAATEHVVLAEHSEPMSLAALYARGRLCEARGQWDCALGGYQRLLARHQQFVPAHAGMMRLAAHRYDQALWEAHRQALERAHPEHVYVGLTWFELGEHDARHQTPADGGEDLFVRAWRGLAGAAEALDEDGVLAMDRVRPAVERTPALAPGLVVAGQASVLLFEPEAARDYFLAALADSGLRAEFYHQVQVIAPKGLVALGRPDLALPLSLAVDDAPTLPTDAQAQTRGQVLARYEATRPAHLSEPYEVGDAPTDIRIEALQVRASVLRELGSSEQAVRTLEPLLTQERWSDEARLGIARAHMVAGRRRAARTIVGQIKDEAQRAQGVAALAYASGKFEEAVDAREVPGEWESRRILALSFLALGRGRDAAGVLDERMELDLTRLRIYARSGEVPADFESAVERWNQVGPVGVSHLVDLGTTAFWRRDLERAQALFEQALELAPGHPEVNWQMGLLERLAGEDARARGYFRRSWRGDENDSSLLIELGRVHLDFERYEMAREAFLLATLRDRRSVAAVEGLGRAYMLGDPARGRRDLPQLLRDYSSSAGHAPAVAEMNKWLAILHGSREGDEAAAPHLQRAREVGGNRADVLAEMGRYHLARQESELAREYFARALQKNPTAPAPHWGLAQVALQDGEQQRAAEHLDRLEALDAEAPWPELLKAARTALKPVAEVAE
ncbi:hypothetical protein DL240_06230 [Lujinxingia litoralis]|uniref:Uncharacterized protein n=1 Tax=Lujinxingia litoralis TaxID=2211119 RepID=A0A328C848_9DELT|nr:tetratricopeptide repeat protein [Lujinxingia litoralis]RAL23750.1 hypothetical protein DL240_06230 [Lujinxingia litoralis]